VGGIHLWSVNQHRGKFPSLVARQPPPIKITIKSHAFHAGIINNRTQLLPFKETRRQRQTTSQLFVTCPRSREWKRFSVASYLSTPPFPGGQPPDPPMLAAKAALSEERYAVLNPPPPSQSALSTCTFRHPRCPHGSEARDWADQMSHPQNTGSLLELS